MQQLSLKALSRAVLKRNQERNQDATMQEKERNFDPENDPQKLRQLRDELSELRTPNPATRFCRWCKTEVDNCALPCWLWRKNEGTVRACEHFRKYMVGIGRWSPEA